MLYKKAGFTLVELIIVFAIVGIFSALTLSYYNSFSEDYKLENEAKQLENVLALAQKKASSGDDSSTLPACPVVPFPTPQLAGYRITVINNSTYTLQRVCGSGAVTPAPLQQFIIPTNVPVRLTTPAAGPAITFQTLASGVSPAAGTTFRLRNSINSKCIDVTVSALGNVTKGSIFSC